MGRTTPAHAPAGRYSRAMLGVYEMTRVELLRDLFVWAYERSTQDYLDYLQQLRIASVQDLQQHQPQLTQEQLALACGFGSARDLRRVYARYRVSPR
ncbi:MAG: hypothetical protein ACR2I0_05550 [Rhodoferax sp.]